MARKARAEEPDVTERAKNNVKTSRRRKRAKPENVAATGIAEPSENPQPGAGLGGGVQQAENLVTALRREASVRSESALDHRGQITRPGPPGPRDKEI
jgi:hypothetical protein